MSILVGRETRLLVQGITGREGEFHSRAMLEYGTKVVAGVTPGKGGQTALDGAVPVFDTVAEAVRETGANTSLHLRPGRRRAGRGHGGRRRRASRTIFCITEGIPALDMVPAVEVVRRAGARLIGPNCPGATSPGSGEGRDHPGLDPSRGPRRRGQPLRDAHLRGGPGDDRRRASASRRASGSAATRSSARPSSTSSSCSPPTTETEAIVLIGEIGGAAEETAAAWAAEHLARHPEGRVHRRPDRARGQADGPRRRDHLGRRRDGGLEGRRARGGRLPRRRLPDRAAGAPARRRLPRLGRRPMGALDGPRRRRRARRSCWRSGSTTSPALDDRGRFAAHLRARRRPRPDLARPVRRGRPDRDRRATTPTDFIDARLELDGPDDGDDRTIERVDPAWITAVAHDPGPRRSARSPAAGSTSSRRSSASCRARRSPGSATSPGGSWRSAGPPTARPTCSSPGRCVERGPAPDDEASFAANRSLWDAWTAIHATGEFYDLEGFKAGGVRLRPYEIEMVGDVAGRSLLHLQCHFGIDTLSWARLGARVTGADLSPAAIELARVAGGSSSASRRPASSGRTCTTCRPPSTARSTSSTRRAASSAGCPTSAAGRGSSPTSWPRAGAFFITESHPVVNAFENEGVAPGELRLVYPYWEHRSRSTSTVKGSYADPTADVGDETEHGWDHGLGEIVTALIDAGLRIERSSSTRSSTGRSDFLVEDRRRAVACCRPTPRGELPLMFSLVATKPA